MSTRALLSDAFREAFPSLSPEQIPSATMETLADWNSLGVARLVIAIERRIGRTIDTDRLMELTSFAAFEAYLTGTFRRYKGIITDLDHTLWSGVLVEDGTAVLNTAYADFLRDRMSQGILVAVASKNDPDALAMTVATGVPDAAPILNASYPVIVSWHPKSDAVTDILRAWNIDAADVVVVDDSAAELHEIQRVHPTIRCVRMTHGVPSELFDLPWATSTTEEARTRMDTLRSNLAFIRERDTATDPTAFLRDLHGVLVVTEGWTPRVQELCERTNQFNLNGIRFTKDDLTRPETFLLSFDYMDRFGRMGVVGAIYGVDNAADTYVEGMWLSCRAFNRRIEHHMVDVVVERFARDPQFNYVPLGRNVLVGQFLQTRYDPVVRPHKVICSTSRP